MTDGKNKENTNRSNFETNVFFEILKKDKLLGFMRTETSALRQLLDNFKHLIHSFVYKLRRKPGKHFTTSKKNLMSPTLVLLIIPLFLMLTAFTPSYGEETVSGPDRYVSDRFIFLGWLYNKPLISTITFNRGYSESGKFKYVAEYQGYLLFARKWHNMKNGNYLETDSFVNIDQIPDFKPCIMKWKEQYKSGGINYDYQEVSMMMQFRNLRWIDTMGKEPDFLINTAIGEAQLQFQGNNVPGIVIYRHKNLTGYNRLSHNFNHLKYRKLEQFFLYSQDNDIYIIRSEQEGNKISGQLVPHSHVIHVDKNGNVALLKGNVDVKWIGTEKENDPDAKFRIYPVKWDLTVGVPPEKMELSRTSGFYWFSYGLSGVRGVKAGRLIMGLAEIIRGD